MTALRRMRWPDIERVVEIERQLFPSDPWTAGMFWSELAGVPETRHYVVAVDDTAGVVGYAGLFATRPDADVQTVAVESSAQGRGLGAAMLRDLLGAARARGCTRVFLEVRADNVAALALYRRHGFAQVGVRRGYYAADGVDALVLAARLGDAERVAAGG